METQFGNLNQLHWLWLLPLCLAAIAYAAIARRRALQRFATANRVGTLVPTTGRARAMMGALLAATAMGMMVLALVDVRWGKTWHDVPQKGIELMMVLDVSRSMLAEDVTPSRLERAKQQIKDTVDELTGDRVGLVVFAGDVKQQIPLTSHYDDFKQALDEVGPHDIRRGGSRLGDAIDAAANGFLTKTLDHKAMLIFTDGEDQESKPLEAARRAYRSNGIRIFTVGLGDIDQGARIPVTSDNHRQYLTHEGQPVWSKLHGDILQQVATQTEGAYIPAGVKRVNMADVYHRYIADVEKQNFETARINSYEARFQWFLGGGLILLLLEIAVTTWPARQEFDPRRDPQPQPNPTGTRNTPSIKPSRKPPRTLAPEGHSSVA